MPRTRQLAAPLTLLATVWWAPLTPLQAQGITIETPVETATVVAPPLRFEGAAPPSLTSAKLYLYEGTEPMPPTIYAQDVVLKGGRWSLEVDEAQVQQLGDGPYTASVLPLGDTMITGTFVTFGLVVRPPLRVEAPVNGALLLTEPVVLRGTTSPDTTVQVRLSDSATPAEARADASGAWTLTLEPTPPHGFHLLRASVQKPGRDATTSRAVLVQLAAGDPERDVDGTFTTPTPTLQGLAPDGAQVALTIDSRVPVTRPVMTGGRWTYEVQPPLEDGPHTLAIQVLNAQNQPLHEATFDLTTRDDTPAITSERCAMTPGHAAPAPLALGLLAALGLGARRRRHTPYS